MYRKIINYLEAWKESEHRKPLILQGARQVGKTYSILDFAEKNYQTTIYLNFEKNPGDKELFSGDLDVRSILERISLKTGKSVTPKKTVLVFDEIGYCAEAYSSLKWFTQDGKFDVIASGSLLGVLLNNSDDSLSPMGYVDICDMYPMDFEEFLWGMGVSQKHIDYIKSSMEKREPLDKFIFDSFNDLFRRYLIVGGMPQAVAEWVETKDFDEVDRTKRNILSLYRSDISKYARGQEARVTKIFDTIPSQLQKHEKKFKLSALGKGTRGRNVENAFFWLDESRVVNTCFAASEPTVGLEMKTFDSQRKLYMADTGLLVSHAFTEAAIKAENLYLKLMHDKLEVNKGMLMENLVAQMLRTAGHRLYFFSQYSKTEAEERMEVDFLVPKPVISSRHNIHPIEVKSSPRYTLTSIGRFVKKFERAVAEPIVLHTKDLKIESHTIYLPLYMSGLL